MRADWKDNVRDEELEQTAAMASALEGTIRFHEGDRTGGITQVREAILAVDHVPFEYGPPWSAKPLDELLGELLLSDGRREEAAAAFEKTLSVYPNRRLAREGLAAAQSLGAPGERISPPHPTRQELIGAWRLVSIQIEGPTGPMLDPFYNEDSTGLARPT